MERIKSFDLVWDENSKILILGTAPSVKSLEQGFFYMHPQNRFWEMIFKITGAKADSVEGKKTLLLENNIALWDVIESCERDGSMDSAIRRPLPNNIDKIPNIAEMKIFLNGCTAFELFKKFFPSLQGELLPSTSPANRKYFDEEKWMQLKEFLK